MITHKHHEALRELSFISGGGSSQGLGDMIQQKNREHHEKRVWENN